MGRNLSESLIERTLDSVNRIGNLQLLLGRENLEKSNIPFGQWIQTRDREFLDRHLIPQQPSLWNVEALPDFVRAREELIRQRMRQLDFQPIQDPRPALRVNGGSPLRNLVAVASPIT